MNEKENKLLLNKMSSPRNVVGDLPLTWLLFLGRHCGHGSAIQGRYKEKTTLLNRLDPGSTPGMTTTTKSAEDSRTLRAARHSAMTALFNVNAFTLIELLVVVLIIGILAAVAVPQYEKAIIKSRVSAILPLLKDIKDAEEVYQLTNNEYTPNFQLLDIEIPKKCKISTEGTEVACDDFFIQIVNVPDIKDYRISASYCPQNNLHLDYATCANKRDFLINFRFSLYANQQGNKIVCTAFSTLGQKICTNMFAE